MVGLDAPKYTLLVVGMAMSFGRTTAIIRHILGNRASTEQIQVSGYIVGLA